MDKENNSVRKYLCQRAELIGAIRLPDNTFKSNAGTEVTCQEVRKVGADIWMKAPSGWMAAYYEGQIFIK